MLEGHTISLLRPCHELLRALFSESRTSENYNHRSGLLQHVLLKKLHVFIITVYNPCFHTSMLNLSHLLFTTASQGVHWKM